ncbi:MAG TPA: MFS transporter [Trebonia sp.]|nr:MFS transporter [Trebonia sp.]
MDRPPRRTAGPGTAATVPLAGAIAVYGLTMAFQGTSQSLFLANAVHATPALIGAYFTARAAAGIVVNQAAGWLSDRVRDRRVLLAVAGAGGAIGTVTLAGVHDYVVVLVTGMVFLSIGGITFGQLFAYANTFAVAGGRDVTAFSAVMRAVFSAAWVVGPPLGLFLLAGLGFRSFYLVVACLSLVSAVVGRWGLPPVAAPASVRHGHKERGHKESGHQRHEHKRRASGARWKVPALPARLWLLLAVVLVLGIVNQMYFIDIPLHVTKDTGHGPQLVGWMAGVTAAAEIPVMIIAGRIAHRVGPGRIVGASAVAGMALYAVLPFAASVPTLLAMAALNGVYQGVSLSIPMVMVQDEAPGGPGSSSALYTSAFGVAGMLAGAVTGAVTTAVGYGDLFWVCAALSGCAAVLMAARASLARARP